MANFIQMHNPDLEWKAAPFPVPADKPELQGFTFVDMDILIIPKGAKNVEGAWEFIKYVQSQEGMELLCTGQAKHTPLVHVSEEFWAQHKNPQIKLFHQLAFSKAAFSPVKLSMWPEIQGEMNAVYDAISGPGLEDVKSRLDKAQNRLQPILEKELRIRRAREQMLEAQAR
jgi:multiple sugar transport system substrate-binding protein